MSFHFFLCTFCPWRRRLCGWYIGRGMCECVIVEGKRGGSDWNGGNVVPEEGEGSGRAREQDWIKHSPWFSHNPAPSHISKKNRLLISRALHFRRWRNCHWFELDLTLKNRNSAKTNLPKKCLLSLQGLILHPAWMIQVANAVVISVRWRQEIPHITHLLFPGVAAPSPPSHCPSKRRFVFPTWRLRPQCHQRILAFGNSNSALPCWISI